MARDDRIQLFENKRIRTAWDAEKEEWFFSIVDVVAVLTDQPDQRHAAKYWSVLKTRLKKEYAVQTALNPKPKKLIEFLICGMMCYLWPRVLNVTSVKVLQYNGTNNEKEAYPENVDTQ